MLLQDKVGISIMVTLLATTVHCISCLLNTNMSIHLPKHAVLQSKQVWIWTAVEPINIQCKKPLTRNTPLNNKLQLHYNDSFRNDLHWECLIRRNIVHIRVLDPMLSILKNIVNWHCKPHVKALSC